MTKWVTFILDQRLLFVLLTGAVLVLSLFLVRGLNVEAFPDPAPAILEIVSIYEGRSAEEVERQITLQLEVALAGMPEMERVNSISLYGLSDIKCKFSYNISYKEAKQEVINRLAGAQLPPDVQPSIVPNAMGEVMRYRLAGSENLLDLRTLQDWTVARYLKTADGVEDVSGYGAFIKAYNVTVEPENLIKNGVTLAQVLDALSKTNLNVGGRTIAMGDQYYMVRGLGLVKTPADIENALIAYKNGKPVLVKNVAEVSIGNIPRTGIAGLNDNDDIAMGVVVLRKGAQSIPSIRSLHEKIRELNERILPRGIRVEPFYERWDLIVTVVKKVIETACSGVVLVLIALLLFMGNFRVAVITALVIPISLAITLAIMTLMGESANLLSIGAIDFGIIVDIPLILIENYFRLSHRYGPGSRSIVRASDEVGKPILFSAMIILLAFIPIFMMKGAEAQVFSPMAKTYLYAIIFTLILTFTYLIASTRVFLRNVTDREFRFVVFLRDLYVGAVERLLRRYRTVLAVVAVIMLAGFGLGAHYIGSEFLPKMDEGNIYMRIIFPYSISLEKTYENAVLAKQALFLIPEIKTVEFQVGRPEDGTDPTGPFNSEYYIDLKPQNEWRTASTKEDLEDIVREKMKALFPNADVNLSQYIADNLEEVMSGVKGENSVKVFGDDLTELDRLAKGAQEGLERTPGVEDVGVFRELGQPNLLIDVDRGNAAALGLTVEDVLDAVEASIGGKEVSKIIQGEKNFSLMVRFPVQNRKNPESIKTIPLVLPDGGIVPLSRVADIRYDTGASFIYRENFRRFIPVKFAVTSQDLGGTVKLAQNEVAKNSIPEGYYMEWSGLFNEMEESFKRFYVSIPIAFFLILSLLFVLYRSSRNVFLTMVAPLFAVFGGVLSLMLAKQSINVSSIVGFISIVGVSILNTSILINHYIKLVIGGMENIKAMLETARDKFRPILMGGILASLGLLPAALSRGIGSQTQKPLAIVVVGGMFLGTFMILLIAPLLLKFVEVRE
jgi:cobalt-zinc-cadmium resistance protein CzcA